MLITIHVITRPKGFDLWKKSCNSPHVGILIVCDHSDVFSSLTDPTVNSDLLDRIKGYSPLCSLGNFLFPDK